MRAAGRGEDFLTKNGKNRLLWAAALAALAVFAAAMAWLHYQQLCSPGGGTDPYTSDLGQHLAFAQNGMIYSLASLLIHSSWMTVAIKRRTPRVRWKRSSVDQSS